MARQIRKSQILASDPSGGGLTRHLGETELPRLPSTGHCPGLYSSPQACVGMVSEAPRPAPLGGPVLR